MALGGVIGSIGLGTTPVLTTAGIVTTGAGGAVYLSGRKIEKSINAFKANTTITYKVYFKWKSSSKTNYEAYLTYISKNSPTSISGGMNCHIGPGNTRTFVLAFPIFL